MIIKKSFQINKNHTKNSSFEDDKRLGWKRLGRYGILSQQIGSRHTKRNKKSWTSKHENHKITFCGL